MEHDYIRIWDDITSSFTMKETDHRLRARNTLDDSVQESTVDTIFTFHQSRNSALV